MARCKKKNKVRIPWLFVLAAALVLSAAALITLREYFSLPSFIPSWKDVGEKVESLTEKISSDYDLPISGSAKTLSVHFVDVGQGDSILLQCGGKNALIDAGDKKASADLIAYLKNQGVERLDTVFITHPDADHIGGMAQVIDALEIGEVVMGEFPEELTPTTQTYTDLLLTIARKGTKMRLAKAGDRFTVGETQLQAVAPTAGFDSLNNCSLGLRAVYGETSFLFTGDMEKQSEKATILEGYDLQSDVLKVGHHGAKTSTSEEFLKAVSPRIAVISCGVDNRYGHPTSVVLERLEAVGAKVYRTDLAGTVVIVSDGKELEVSETGKK